MGCATNGAQLSPNGVMYSLRLPLFVLSCIYKPLTMDHPGVVFGAGATAWLQATMNVTDPTVLQQVMMRGYFLFVVICPCLAYVH